MDRKKLAAAVLVILWLMGSSSAYAAPQAENMEFAAVQGEEIRGKLSARADEGDAFVFILTTPPVKGTLELREDGEFVYTAPPRKRGKDYFGYRVKSADGALSEEAAVIIRILKAPDRSLSADPAGTHRLGR